SLLFVKRASEPCVGVGDRHEAGRGRRTSHPHQGPRPENVISASSFGPQVPRVRNLASGLTTFSSLNSYRGAEEAFKIPHQRPVHIENLDEMMWTGGTNLSTAETILAVLPLWRIVE